MAERHKHADLIHAWCEGAEIEYSYDGYEWGLITKPGWDEDYGYRIKPESKPDVVRYGHTDQRGGQYFYCSPDSYANIKLTFDGETGNLKAAEVIE